ncbi:MAG: hypothetical protein CYPHOPRED_003329 [Cyphobasidiales sp. Tagirdzhanova-0007]|nr:MAG: hypothetical protein CYPHOPRED_003329 [Cyphobasidiales sp. Tagirdzhanova-0007]
MHAFSLLFAFALSITYTRAGLHFSSPSNTTHWNAWSETTLLKWRESGTLSNRTTLAQLGAVSFSLWTGSTSGGNTKVANLGTADASAKQLRVTIPSSAGKNGKIYFIHAASANLTSKTYTSDKFELSGMSGSGNGTIGSSSSGQGTIGGAAASNSTSQSNSTSTSTSTSMPHSGSTSTSMPHSGSVRSIGAYSLWTVPLLLAAAVLAL